jgi:SAM-dependent methyltransferase
MSHYTQRQFVRFVREFFPEDFRGRRVLEVGSLDINGSLRSLFERCDYVGLDVAPGPGVDVVCQGQAYAAADASFDITLSVEAMEHNPHWRETFDNMVRLTRPGGLVVMTCATSGRPEHGTTRSKPHDSPLTLGLGWDYYRNLTATDFMRECRLDALGAHAFFTYHYSNDLFFLGVRGRDAEREARVAAAAAVLRRRYLARNWMHWRSLKTMAMLRLRGADAYVAAD